MARRFRGLKIAGQVVLGLGLGLVIAELGFSWRDDGAFPHANFYVPDAELGVRLEPGATMRFQLRKNPLTTIHVNARGYRGGEWAAPADGEVIVVGDSQVFGLGVEDDATFSAGLARHAGRPVVNGGVPTYGPMEYMAVARELLAERRAKTVVVVLNFVNDPFELGRPNRERHAVWDGWAVRSETAPTEVTQFPGRHWLYSRSHAVFAARRWLHARGGAPAPDGAELDDPLDFGTPSEGGWRDLVVTTKQAHAEVTGEHAEVAGALADSQVRLAQVDAEITKKRRELDQLVSRETNFRFASWEHAIARGQPGDIVEDTRSESSRSVELTAVMIREAAKKRQEALDDILRAEQRAGDHAARDLLTAEKNLAAERLQLRGRIAAGVTLSSRPPSQFREYLSNFKSMCEQHGAELVVVALPIDVQVDRGEWAKYGVTDGPDMSDSLVLIDDLIADARDLGLRALDATPVLRAAEPGAFLDHDIHMTAKGHAALAEALAGALAAPVPAPMRLPDAGLPAGMTFVPPAGEWLARDSVLLINGHSFGCQALVVRGWLRVQCSVQRARGPLRGVEVRAGGTPATMVMHTADSLSMVTQLRVGEPISARFYWEDVAADFELSWYTDPGGAQQSKAELIERPGVEPPAGGPSAAVLGLCKCQQEVSASDVCIYPFDPLGRKPIGMPDCRKACVDLWGDSRLAEACTRTFPDDCVSRLACAQNDPLFAPVCPEGQVHAFASNACFPVCDPVRTCAAGNCVPWQGGSVCL
jgi:hypothetical protein